MFEHVKRLRGRASKTAERAAIGSAVPAGYDPSDSASAAPTARDRGTMRRRLRRRRRDRQAMLLELGALVFEMHRRGHRDPELVERRASDLRLVDDEVHGLAHALDSDEGVDRVVAAGLVSRCPECGELVSTDARFCSSCGVPLARAAARSSPAPGGAKEAPGEDGAAQMSGMTGPAPLRGRGPHAAAMSAGDGDGTDGRAPEVSSATSRSHGEA